MWESIVGKKSRTKGARGELEWAAFLSENGFPARRGRQYHGRPEAPDVVCEPLAGYHFEVKRTEKLSVYKALEQATTDSDFQVPVVAHRRNQKDWLVIMDGKDFLDLVRKAMGR